MVIWYTIKVTLVIVLYKNNFALITICHLNHHIKKMCTSQECSPFYVHPFITPRVFIIQSLYVNTVFTISWLIEFHFFFFPFFIRTCIKCFEFWVSYFWFWTMFYIISFNDLFYFLSKINNRSQQKLSKWFGTMFNQQLIPLLLLLLFST